MILYIEIHFDKSPQGLLHQLKSSGSKLHLKYFLKKTKAL